MSAPKLTADCSRCCGLCCVALALVKSPELAIEKQAHEPCPHLDASFRCSVHADLHGAGFSGCAAYDCYGAGQFVTQQVFAGRAWTAVDDPALMFDVFTVVRDLFEQLALLETARALVSDAAIDLRASLLLSLANRTPLALRAVDVHAERASTLHVLRSLRPRVRRLPLVNQLRTAPPKHEPRRHHPQRVREPKLHVDGDEPIADVGQASEDLTEIVEAR